MISIQRLNARGANKNGDAVVDYLLATEYYTNGQGQAEENTRWGGLLAAELGLAGRPVEKEAMLQLARGYAPDGTALCKNAGEEPREVVKRGRDGKPKLDKHGNEVTKLEGGHRVGFDLTFSAPKSFSIAFAIAEGEDRDKILDAHRRAVAAGMAYMEEKVETRRGHAGRDVIATEGLIYMQADHLASRNMDMNLHTHNLVFGVAKGADGQWGTFDAIELYNHRMAADVLYKNELAMNMRELGYAVEVERERDADEQETGRTLYRVAGISDALCEKFSTRRQELLEYAREHGVDHQTANLATRRHKDEPSYAEMTAMWKRTMEAMEDGQVPTIAQLKGQQDKSYEACTTHEALEKLHATESVFTDKDLVRVLGQEHAGQVRTGELMAKIAAFKQTEGLVAIEGERLAEDDQGKTLARRHTETRYAAPWMVDWEREIVHRIDGRKDEGHQHVPADQVAQAIAAYEKRKGFQLTGEQRTAVETLTMGTGGVALLEGFAGTGKTTVSDCYSDAFKAAGRRLLGVCVANDAAQKLEQESGMQCVSVAMMLGRLDKGRFKLTEKDVLVVDEAGMIDTNQTRRLLAHADQAGAKVILQGDELQLQPVGAGSGMSLAKMAVGSVKLTEIRRQSRVEDRELATMFYHRDEQGQFADLKKGTRSRQDTLAMGQAIVAALDKRGALDDYDTQTQAIDALVDDYFKSEVPESEKLVLGHSRAEVATLNDKLRQGFKERGMVDGRETVVRAKDRGQWTELALARGDRVRFTEADKELGVVNGSQGVLIDCAPNREKGGADLTVRLVSSIAKQHGRLVSFNTNDCAGLAHNFATTVHKSQGQGKAQVYHLANTGMLDNHSALVAFTRLTKGDYRMYGTTEDIERLKERVAMERLKETALGAGLRQPATQQAGLSEAEQQALADSARAFAQRLGQVQQRAREQGQDLGNTL